MKINFQDATVQYSDALRDGGSVVLLLIIKGERYILRMMRSIGERDTPHYNRYELKRVSTGEIRILGDEETQLLADFLRGNEENIKTNVYDAMIGEL
ncbi:hypothetical protein [Halovulum sp. GXIMD14793]